MSFATAGRCPGPRGPAVGNGPHPGHMGPCFVAAPYPLWCAPLPPLAAFCALRVPFCAGAPSPARVPFGAGRPPPLRGSGPGLTPAGLFGPCPPRAPAVPPGFSARPVCAAVRLRGRSLAPLCFGLALVAVRAPCSVALPPRGRGSGASRVPRRVPPWPSACWPSSLGPASPPRGFGPGGSRPGACPGLRPGLGASGPRAFPARGCRRLPPPAGIWCAV